jgi:hypothetical protein
LTPVTEGPVLSKAPVSAGGAITGTWADAVATDIEASMNFWRATIFTKRVTTAIGMLVGIALATIGTGKNSAAIIVLVGVALGNGAASRRASRLMKGGWRIQSLIGGRVGARFMYEGTYLKLIF